MKFKEHILRVSIVVLFYMLGLYVIFRAKINPTVVSGGTLLETIKIPFFLFFSIYFFCISIYQFIRKRVSIYNKIHLIGSMLIFASVVYVLFSY